ncbi:DUF4062 domain-containing protein [Cryptosporangium sp. NPDC051539]|uniref:DUF4062 domain-containing protein n=1 Tax=Cryptosporangium sp. NPDC051539 TaxID=3363962 RepID=UPI00378F1B82
MRRTADLAMVRHAPTLWMDYRPVWTQPYTPLESILGEVSKMANFRVLVSSTAYDMAVLRSSLRGFIHGLGYEAILSEYSDILYDPREHAHKNCLDEVGNCDAVVLVVGSRFGSTLTNRDAFDAIRDVDVRRFMRGEGDSKVSITQAEALYASGCGGPVFAFVEAAVYHDYKVYQRNKGLPFAAEIVYPSISQPNSAEHIFDFITYLESRSFNNVVITFDRLEEILDHLRKQWAALFQRLLSESRNKRDEGIRIDRLADQFEDLKAALLATVGDADSRGIARAVIRYRRLIDFMRSLPNTGEEMRAAMVSADYSWPELLLKTAGITEFQEVRTPRHLGGTMLVRPDTDTEILMARMSPEVMQRISSDWQGFRGLSPTIRAVVYDTHMDSDERHPQFLVRRVSPDQLAEVTREGEPERVVDPDSEQS